MFRSPYRLAPLALLACGLLAAWGSPARAEPMSTGFTKMADGAEVIAVARLAGDWDPGEWRFGQKNGGSLELELTRVIKGDLKPGRYRVFYDDRPFASKDRESVVFLGKGRCWRFVAYPISDENTVANGVLRVIGFYDYNSYMVSPGLVTLAQIETFVKERTLTYTVRGPLYFPKRGRAAWEASRLEVEVRYDARTGEASVNGLPEPKGFPARPEVWVSPYEGSNWVRVTYSARPGAYLTIEGQVHSADPNTGALLARFFVGEPTVLTPEELEGYLADPLQGRSFYTVKVACAPFGGEVRPRLLTWTVGGDEDRRYVLEGWSEKETRLEWHGPGPTEGGRWTQRAVAKLATGEELELRFDWGPEREPGSSSDRQPSGLVHLLAVGDVPGRVLLHDGNGEREVTTFTASLGGLRFTRLEQPRSEWENTKPRPPAEEEGAEPWACESARSAAIDDGLMLGWYVLVATGVLAAVIGWRVCRRRRQPASPAPRADEARSKRQRLMSKLRTRRVRVLWVALVVVLSLVAGLAAWLFWLGQPVRSLQDRFDRVELEMTQGDVKAIMGPPTSPQRLFLSSGRDEKTADVLIQSWEDDESVFVFFFDKDDGRVFKKGSHPRDPPTGGDGFIARVMRALRARW
jgi:hypothetical protein